MTTRSMCLAVVAVGVLAAPGRARCDPPPAVAAPHRTVVFAPDRPDRCDYFFVTEFNASVTGTKSQDAVDRLLFTDSFGLMRNVDRTRAVGISIDAHLTAGAIRFAPTIRVKQWLAGRQSLDLSLGYASASLTQEGAVGTIVNVRYSPNAWCHIQAGGCRIRNVHSIWYYPDFHVDEESAFQFYAGVGLGGVPAVISWGAQGIVFAGLMLAFANME